MRHEDSRLRTRGSRCLALILAATTSLGVIGVRAEGTGNSYELGSPWPPPAGPECRPSTADAKHAKELFDRGAEAHLARDYPKAFRDYRDAYLADCTAHLLLSNMAKVLEAAKQYQTGLEVLRTYAERRKPTGIELTELNERIERLARLAVTTPNASSSPSVPSEASSTTITIVPTTTTTSSAYVYPPPPHPSVTTLPLPPPPPRHSTMPALITMGAGTAVMIAGGIIAGVGNAYATDISSKQRQLFEEVGCPSGPECAADRARSDRLRSDAEAMRTVGLVSLGVGSAAVVGGLIWYLFTPRSSGEPKATRTQVKVVPTAMGIGLVGSF